MKCCTADPSKVSSFSKCLLTVVSRHCTVVLQCSGQSPIRKGNVAACLSLMGIQEKRSHPSSYLPKFPELSLSHQLCPGSHGVPCEPTECTVVEEGFGDPVVAECFGRCLTVWATLGGCISRRARKGPAKFVSGHGAVGSSAVIPGQSHVCRLNVGDTGNGQ